MYSAKTRIHHMNISSWTAGKKQAMLFIFLKIVIKQIMKPGYIILMNSRKKETSSIFSKSNCHLPRFLVMSGPVCHVLFSN